MFYYFSVRPICIDGKRLLTPKYALKDNFPGLILSWKCIATSTKTDGRWLYEVEVETEEHGEVIWEGLQTWSGHFKSEVSTIKLLTILTGRTDCSFIDGKLNIPNIEEQEKE